MANDSNGASSGGIGVAGLLGVAFVVLKLTHTISWSWWWILAPFWAPTAIVAVLVLVGFVLVGIKAVIR